MTVIDLTTVKENLGITGTDLDATITAQIPIIDAKVKQICGNNFNTQIVMNTTNGSPYAEVMAVYQWWGGGSTRHDAGSPTLNQILEDIPTGTIFEGGGVPRCSVLEVYYDAGATISGVSYSAPFVKLSENATATGTGVQAFYGWNVAYDSVISKGVQYLINNTSTTITDESWSSKSYGPVSVSKGAGGDGKIDMKSGMPLWFVKAMPRYM